MNKLINQSDIVCCYCCLVARSHLTLCDPMDFSTPGFPVLHNLPEFAQTHWVCPLSPLSQWCYLIISSSASLFSFCLQSFSASESFPMSQLFASGGQSIGASASVSVLSMNSQGWFPLEFTDFISLLSKELSRVFSSNSKTTILQHSAFFMVQLHICTWLLKKT